MSDSTELDAQLTRARPPQDDLEARDQMAELESRMFGKARDPIRVGRHIVLHRVGVGGLGVVFAAYDPELDRKVALKLLRTDRGPGGDKSSNDPRARLVREAQALAKLSHPNVITVYDVGTWDDQVYIAMELVQGRTLAQWLGEHPRSWREVVAVFVGAGQGLAAAHDAGLVHRDFKPANVLVGDDGRVRVLDFGLAKPRASLAGAAPDAEAATTARLDLTLSGAVLGTPAYMAPEQYNAAPVNALADQYAFCVALWEALYGRRPFAGASVHEIVQRKRELVLDDPENGSINRAPERLRTLLLRGLSPDPDKRFADMHALLAELQRDPTATRRRVLLATLGASALGGLAFATWPTREDPCVAMATRMDDVWDPTRRAALAQSFSSTQRPFAEQAWARAGNALDDYAAAWIDRRVRACTASAARGEATLGDLATDACLEHRLQDLAEVIRVLEVADPQIVENAVYAVASLPDLSTCDSSEATSEAVAQGDAARLEVERLLARARALLRTGKYDDALTGAREAGANAARSEYGSGRARALLLEGLLLAAKGTIADAEEALRDALTVAEQVADDDTSARAATELFYVVGVDMARHDEAHRWAELARAKIARRGDPAHLLGEYMNALGVLLFAEGRHAEAEAAHTEALDLRRGQTGEDHVLVASSLNNLGSVAMSRGDPAKAREYFERALAAHEAALGPDHPASAFCRENLATALSELDQPAEAVAQHERALAILERAFGRRHPAVVTALNNLGISLRQNGSHARAQSVLEDALVLAGELTVPKHPITYTIHTNLGEVLRERGDLDGAIAQQELAIEGLEALYGLDHPNLVYPLVNAAKAYAAGGQHERARAALERARVLVDVGVGVGRTHPLSEEVSTRLRALR